MSRNWSKVFCPVIVPLIWSRHRCSSVRRSWFRLLCWVKRRICELKVRGDVSGFGRANAIYLWDWIFLSFRANSMRYSSNDWSIWSAETRRSRYFRRRSLWKLRKASNSTENHQISSAFVQKGRTNLDRSYVQLADSFELEHLDRQSTIAIFLWSQWLHSSSPWSFIQDNLLILERRVTRFNSEETKERSGSLSK